MVSKSIAVALLLGVALFAAASPAVAEAPTRQQYVDQLEGICKPDALATQRAMQGARTDVKAERFTAAAPKFARATRIFGGTLKQIAAVPRPEADRAKLAQWFVYLNRQEDYLRQITDQLRRDHVVKAQRLLPRFYHNGNQANYTVLAFGFNYCSFKFSRYG
jgi:hypothetical protein